MLKTTPSIFSVRPPPPPSLSERLPCLKLRSKVGWLDVAPLAAESHEGITMLEQELWGWYGKVHAGKQRHRIHLALF